MTTIIPIDQLANYLLSAIKAFYSQYSSTLSITVNDCLRIVYHAIDDEISSRLHWCRTTTNLEDLLQDLFHWFNPTCDDQVSDLFYRKIIDELQIHVSELVDKIIPTHSWSLYECHLKSADVIIIEGVDYRVHDWTNRVNKGEIKLDKDVTRRPIYKRKRGKLVTNKGRWQQCVKTIDKPMLDDFYNEDEL